LFTDYAVGVTEFEVPVWLLYPSRRHLPLKVRAFAEFVRERFRGEAPWGGCRADPMKSGRI
jgi:DNA-binding transcriptional LysR family regulator